MNIAAERPVEWKPGCASRSSTTTRAPSRAMKQAIDAPAMPAPTTIASASQSRLPASPLPILESPLSLMPRLARIVGAALVGVVASLAALPAARADNRERVVTELAPGIHAIRHKDATADWPSGNSLVVEGEREVLVVDSGVLPSAAREDIAQIKQWTDKPVRWLVNTHWHIDHNAGNRSYLEAFPGLAIVAQRATQAMMNEYNPGVPARFVAAYRKQLEALNRQVESGKGEDGKTLTPAAREAASDAASQLADFVGEYEDFRYQGPTLVFDKRLTIDLGGRTVELLFLGRGNTQGDAVVWLPKERILAAGDLLDAPVPYMLGGYPSEWAETLGAVIKLDAAQTLPGHGPVLQGSAHAADVKALLESAIRQVHAEIARRGSGARLEDVQKAVDLREFRSRMSGGDAGIAAFFDEMAASLVRNVFNEARQR